MSRQIHQHDAVIAATCHAVRPVLASPPAGFVGTVYSQGMGFVDPGGDHVHNLRNEGAVEARTIAVQLIPADATRRIDAPDPGVCSF
jgi:hypothetical protein